LKYPILHCCPELRERYKHTYAGIAVLHAFFVGTLEGKMNMASQCGTIASQKVGTRSVFNVADPNALPQYARRALYAEIQRAKI